MEFFVSQQLGYNENQQEKSGISLLEFRSRFKFVKQFCEDWIESVLNTVILLRDS